jgi:hypothetical protein
MLRLVAARQPGRLALLNLLNDFFPVLPIYYFCLMIAPFACSLR